jgi:hypothetical protein
MQQRQFIATQSIAGSQAAAAKSAPIALDAAALKLVAGGAQAAGPNGGWSSAGAAGPNGGW